MRSAIAHGHVRARRAARRLARAAPPRIQGDSVPPPRPTGAKLELTYSCNLRCGFCYTDSPRRTLERATDLSDEDWLRIADDVVESGVFEAVLTGGEPLLRRELTLDMVDRLDRGGIGVWINTNGWFVDAAIADRLAATDLGVNVHISLDGPTPELHDRSRGVPGSWRRAVRAIELLVERGVHVHVVQVVTPDNAFTAPEMVRTAWLLGASSVRFTGVVSIGAAARGGDWGVDEARMRRDALAMRDRLGVDIDIVFAPEVDAGVPTTAPTYLVVRPNGAVLGGSLAPFSFGSAVDDGIAAVWQRIVRDWNHPHVRAWRDPIEGGMPLADAAAVIYRDEEIDVDDAPPAAPPPPVPVALPQRPAALELLGEGDIDDVRRQLCERALRRRYRLDAARWTDRGDGSRYVRSASGSVIRLNSTAALVMDACASGTPADAVERIADTTTGAAAGAIEHDVIAAVRRLTERGVLRALPVES